MVKEVDDMEDKTFIEITNRDIYNKLIKIEGHVVRTNGKVKLNTLTSRLSLALVMGIILTVAGFKAAGLF